MEKQGSIIHEADLAGQREYAEAMTQSIEDDITFNEDIEPAAKDKQT